MKFNSRTRAAWNSINAWLDFVFIYGIEHIWAESQVVTAKLIQSYVARRSKHISR